VAERHLALARVVAIALEERVGERKFARHGAVPRSFGSLVLESLGPWSLSPRKVTRRTEPDGIARAVRRSVRRGVTHQPRRRRAGKRRHPRRPGPYWSERRRPG